MGIVVWCFYVGFDLLFVCWLVASGCVVYVLIVLVWLLFCLYGLWPCGDWFGRCGLVVCFMIVMRVGATAVCGLVSGWVSKLFGSLCAGCGLWLVCSG